MSALTDIVEIFLSAEKLAPEEVSIQLKGYGLLVGGLSAAAGENPEAVVAGVLVGFGVAAAAAPITVAAAGPSEVRSPKEPHAKRAILPGGKLALGLTGRIAKLGNHCTKPVHGSLEGTGPGQMALRFIALILVLLGPSQARTDSNVLVEIPLNKSITTVGPSLAPVDVIVKYYVDLNDARSKYVVLIFHRATKSEARRGILVQIPAYDDDARPVELTDWDSPDCSIDHVFVIAQPGNSKKSVRIVTTHRIEPQGIGITSQASYQPQQLKLYELRENVGRTPGLPPFWFERTSEATTDRALCSSDEVRQEVMTFVASH